MWAAILMASWGRLTWDDEERIQLRLATQGRQTRAAQPLGHIAQDGQRFVHFGSTLSVCVCVTHTRGKRGKEERKFKEREEAICRKRIEVKMFTCRQSQPGHTIGILWGL